MVRAGGLIQSRALQRCWLEFAEGGYGEARGPVRTVHYAKGAPLCTFARGPALAQVYSAMELPSVQQCMCDWGRCTIPEELSRPSLRTCSGSTSAACRIRLPTRAGSRRSTSRTQSTRAGPFPWASKWKVRCHALMSASLPAARRSHGLRRSIDSHNWHQVEGTVCRLFVNHNGACGGGRGDEAQHRPCCGSGVLVEGCRESREA